MESIARPRIVIAGTNSGVGKTTIVTGLLAYFHSKGYAVQPFKVGPDYIDPGFHGKAAGRNSYNLDTWMTPPDRLVPTFASLSKGADISIIEGSMMVVRMASARLRILQRNSRHLWCLYSTANRLVTASLRRRLALGNMIQMSISQGSS